jgi:hypothetical protein
MTVTTPEAPPEEEPPQEEPPRDSADVFDREWGGESEGLLRARFSLNTGLPAPQHATVLRSNRVVGSQLKGVAVTKEMGSETPP